MNTTFKPGMKVRALFENEWQVAYIYEQSTYSDGSPLYYVKRRDWNMYAELPESSLQLLSRGAVYASNVRYQEGQEIEAVQGDTWFKATILEKKHNLYYIKYNDYNEWDWVGDEDLRGESLSVHEMILHNKAPENKQPGLPGAGGDGGGGGSNAPRHVVILQNDTLYRVNATDGSFHLLSPGWTDVKAMAAFGQFVFIVRGETLYRMSIEDGRHEKLGDGWTNVKGIVAL